MSLSDWNIAKAIVFVDIPKLILWRKIDSSPKKTFIKTITGPIVSVSDAVGGPPESLVANIDLTQEGSGDPSPDTYTALGPSDIVSFTAAADDRIKNVTVNIEPVQSGSGDPSPDNVRPITGWTGASVTRTGVNIFGGTLMRDGINAAMPDAAINENDKYISFASNAGAIQNFTAECGLTGKFKELTQYTLIMSIYKTAGTGSNMRVYYTDGSYAVIPAVSEAGVKETVVLVTAANKTVASVTKTNSSGTTRVYYEESGIFEGALTADDFVPYDGTTYPVSWETEAGEIYGGTLDVLTGTLIVTHVKRTYLSSAYWAWNGSINGFISSPNDIAVGIHYSDPAAMCSCFKKALSASATTDPCAVIGNSSVKRVAFCNLTGIGITDVATWKTFLDTHDVSVAYPLADPITYQLTPQEITTLLGLNNIWADCGQTSLTHVAPGNIRPITGWTGASVRVSGKNLWDDSLYALAGWNLVTEGERAGYYNGNSRRFCRNVFGWDGSYGFGLLGVKKEYGRLTISFDSYPTSGAIQVYFYYSDDTSVNVSANLTGKQHVSYSSNPNKNCVGVSINTTVGVTAATQYFKNLQIEIGAEETEYELYAGNIYPVSWETEAGTVYSGNITINPDGSADVYCDKQYCVLDGNSVIGDGDYYAATDSTRMGCIFTNVLPFSAPNVANQTGLIANWAVRETTANKPREKNVSHWSVRSGNSGSSKDLYLYAPYGMEVTESELLEMLTDNPLQVVIPIATPQTYHIDAEDVPGITLFQGKNTVWADTGDVELTYEAESE